MTDLGLVLGAVALACAGAAALADIRSFEIPDHWSIAIAGLFGASTLASGSWTMAVFHLAAGATVFAGGVWLFAKGWLGGGDVKLLAAAALWTGFEGLPSLLGATFAAGALLAVVALLARRFAAPATGYPGLQPGGPLPYAVAIFAGTVSYATALV